MTTVTGRDRAANTKRIFRLRGNSLARLNNERLNVSRGCRNSKQTPPYAEPGQYIVDFSLGEKSLGFGYFVDVPQARLIACGRLLGRGTRSRHLHRGIGGDAPRTIKC